MNFKQRLSRIPSSLRVFIGLALACVLFVGGLIAARGIHVSAATPAFLIGSRVQVSEGPLNVRALPSVNGGSFGVQPAGALGTVIAGPMRGDAYLWWDVNYDSGADGWSVEDYISPYAASPTVPPPPSGVSEGDSQQGMYISNVTLSAGVQANGAAIVGVQFKLDGANLGTEITSAPYTISWNAALASVGSHVITAVVRDAKGNTNTSAPVTVTVPDISSPSVPQNISASAASPSQANLSWNASTDNVGVTGYKIYRNGAPVATTAGTNYQDANLSAATTYSYTIAAYDAAGNTSALSVASSTTTLPPPDTTPPSNPGLTATALSSSQVALSWNAASDNVGVTGYQLERCPGTSCTADAFQRIATVTALSYTDSGLSSSTGYTYRIRAQDAAGNVSAYSGWQKVTTLPPPDTTPPSISLTNPSIGLAVSNTVNVSANANDNVGIVGVQFKLDGANLGSEITAAPYMLSWDTKTVADGTHTLVAVARDQAGNMSTTNVATVIVSNVVALPPPISGTFSVGTRVRVSTGPLNVRSTSVATSPIVGSEAVGNYGTIMSGPVHSGTYTRWNIKYDDGLSGWSIQEGYLISI